MFRNIIVAAGFVAMGALIGCDGLGVEPTEGATNAAVEIAPINHYMAVQKPTLAGLFVQEVNQDQSTCLSGDKLTRYCHIDELDFRFMDLDPVIEAKFTYQFARGDAMVEGWLARVQDGRDYVDKLVVTDAWFAATRNSPRTPIYSVNEADIYCFRAPCPEYAADLVNTEETILLHEVDLTGSGASKHFLMMGEKALATSGLYVAGWILDQPDPPDQRAAGWDIDPGDRPQQKANHPDVRRLSAATFYLPIEQMTHR